MIFTTSYRGMDSLLTELVRSVGAKKIIEFGTQQGHSAVMLARGGGMVKTYDLFEPRYSNPPYKNTHADLFEALANTMDYGVEVFAKDVNEVKPIECDILHIDICNHYDNVYPLVSKWYGKAKMIILEGGVLNKWQKKYGFKPFIPKQNHIILRGKGGYAMTIIT
jgi:hypothetical protein